MQTLTGKEVLEQTTKLDRAIARAFAVEGTDRIGYSMQATMTFSQGENQAGDLVFNVSSDSDFEGHTLNLFLQSRLMDIANFDTKSELTYRPADWTYRAANTITADLASAKFEIRDSVNGAYQTAACGIGSSFSSRAPTPGNNGANITDALVSAWPSALVFPVPYFLPRGASMTVKVTPIFSVRSTTTSRREFRVVGILQGAKLVRRPV